jgi:hypothetical protein
MEAMCRLPHQNDHINGKTLDRLFREFIIALVTMGIITIATVIVMELI